MPVYLRLLRLVRPYWRRLALAMSCMALIAAVTAATALLVKPVLDEVFFQRNWQMLVLLPLVVLALFLLKGLFLYGEEYFMGYVGQRVIADMRDRLYEHLQRLPVAFFTRTPTGVIISRITNDVNLIQAAVTNALTSVLKDLFTVVGLTGVLLYRDWQLALLAFVVLPFAGGFIVKVGRKLRRVSAETQTAMGSLSTRIHETATGTRIVKAFGMEAFESRRFAEENRQLFTLLMRAYKARALTSPAMELLAGIGVAFIIWYGGAKVMAGSHTPGTFFSFTAALLMLYEPVKKLSRVNSAVQEGMAAAHRFFEVLDTPPEAEDGRAARSLPRIEQGIEFREVCFRYDDEVILKGVSFQVRVGETVALVGVSGAGKTTLVNLIPRFYEVTGGQILIDGVDIRDATLASLRAQIGLVTQQTILFNDTVRRNIAYGSPNASEELISRAAVAAHAHGFISRLPQGYDTIIGEGGVRLSGGERQRISIARALLKDPPILILDEATSSLDTESEREVQLAVENLMRNRTTIVIAHRLSTVRNADRILVLAAGRISEVGTHVELMARGGEYSRLYRLQFRDEEVGPVETWAALQAGR